MPRTRRSVSSSSDSDIDWAGICEGTRTNGALCIAWATTPDGYCGKHVEQAQVDLFHVMFTSSSTLQKSLAFAKF